MTPGRAARSGGWPARSWLPVASRACGSTTSCASARRRCRVRSSGSRASGSRSRSTRTPPACGSASPSSTPGVRWRSSSAPACSVASSTGPSARSTCSPETGTTRSGARCSPAAVSVPALDREQAWTFEPRVEKGDSVVAGDVLGVVAEARARAPDPRARGYRRGRDGDPPGPGAAGGPGRVDRRSAAHDAEPLARPRPPPGRRPSRPVDAADHRPAGDRRPVPARPRRSRDDPRRVRHRQDRAPAVAGEVGARRRRRSTSAAESAATSSPRCSRSSRSSSTRAPARR